MIICIDIGNYPPSRLSITLMALLAFDLANGVKINNFLRLQFRESPPLTLTILIGFQMVRFGGPAPEGKDLPINYSPIQKFMW